MNEPEINSRSRDPARARGSSIVNAFNNSKKIQEKSNLKFIHKISNLMETKYDLKRLLRTGTVLALFFAWMLAGSFVANAQIAPQAAFDVILTIEGQGSVSLSGYDNTIAGPVVGSNVGPFADGSIVAITATPEPGWAFVEWEVNLLFPVIGDQNATPNSIRIDGADFELTAIFKKPLTLLPFRADDKPYDGNDVATVTVWGALDGVEGLDEVILDDALSAAVFDDEKVGTDKEVTITGLALAGANAADYHLFLPDPFIVLANINPIAITLNGAVADDKEFDGNTTATVDFTLAALNGVIAPDVVGFDAAGYSANFNNINVGAGKPVTVAGVVLTGADAGNYTLTQPVLGAAINPKELTINAVIEDKVYDGLVGAIIKSMTVSGGAIAGNAPGAVNFGGANATFDNANVGNGKDVTIAGVVTVANGNYVVNTPFVTTGNILAPYYAMFNPTYGVVGVRPTAPVADVPIETPLYIEFNKPVFDVNGNVLPVNDIGDFVKLEKWDGANYQLVPFTSNRVGNKVHIVPDDPLEYSTQYRIRFLNIYDADGVQVAYSLDGEDRDPSIAGSLQIDPDRAVVFNTWDIATATLPVVSPYDVDAAVCGTMTLTFLNPVKYLNGNTITDNPKHKFTLQTFDGLNWVDVPAADWTVAIDVSGAPRVFTFTYKNGTTPFDYNTQYRIRNNVGMDANFGFIDMETGLNLLADEFNYDHQDGNDGWHWTTTNEYPIVVDVAPWPIAPVFPAAPAAPIVSNATFDGNAVVSVGAGPGFAITKDVDFVADVTVIHAFDAINGEGYHFTGWKRSTNGGAAWGALLPIAAPIVNPQLGINYAPQNFNVAAEDIKPATCTQEIGYQANFAINTYTVNVTAVPAPGNTVAGGGVKTHGTTVTLTATPGAGQYVTGWNVAALPASVLETVVENTPDHTAVGYPATGKVSTLTFSIVGNLAHNLTWNVQALFADFQPVLFAATDPQDINSGVVNATVEFGGAPTIAVGVEGAPFQGITYKWEQYVYDTKVKLEAIDFDCRYVFVKWQQWNPSILPAGGWVDFKLTNPTDFFTVDGNFRVKAVFKLRDDVHVSATANDADLATVIIFTDFNRDVPLTINDINGADFTFGDLVYITSYPEPDYYTWRWVDGANNPVVMGGPVRFEDRSEWIYTVGCNDIDLKAVVDLKEYTVAVRSLDRSEGTINNSTPAFNVNTGNQGGLGFTFNDVGIGHVGQGNFQRTKAVTFAATPAAGFAFVKWVTAGGADVSTDNPFTISNLTGPVDLTAVFVSTAPPAPTYALTVENDPVEGGSVNLVSGNYVVGPLAATATAAPGYTFAEWEAVGVALTPAQQVANPVNFNMPANAVTLTAKYVKTAYTFTPVVRTYLRPHANFNIVNWGGVVTRDPAAGTFTAGQTVDLTATPLPGYRFVNWMVGEFQDPPANKILRGNQVSDQNNFTYTIPAVNGNPPLYIYAIFVEVGNPEYPIYNLATVANPAGFGDVTGAGTFAHGVEVLVDQQVTEPGYEFNGWSPNVILPGQYVEMDANKTATANYGKIVYNLIVDNANPGFGAVAQAAGNFVFDGLPIAITATPNVATCEHTYKFDGWYADALLTIPLTDAGGNPVTDAEFNFIPYALPAPQVNLFIYAKFVEEVNEYDVTATVNPPVAGTASISPAGPYNCNDIVTITTVDNPGYEFQYWTKDGVIFIDQKTFNWNVDDDADFEAVYVAIEYNVTANAQAGGTVDPVAQIKIVGDDVEVLATADTGFEFDGWIAVGVVLGDAMANPVQFTMEPNDVILTAKFLAIDYTVTATAGAGGTAAPASQVKHYGDAVTVTATPDAGYELVDWDIVGVVVADPTVNPLVFNQPDNDVTVHANFVKNDYIISLTAVPANGGTFSAIDPTYNVGDDVSITATPNAGFIFGNWAGLPAGAVVDGNKVDFTMPANNLAITATFIPTGNTLVGDVRYFNKYPSKVPASANINVELYDGAVLVGGPVAIGADGAYEFDGIIPGTTYTVKVWEDKPYDNSWNKNGWGGVNATDALIINYMVTNNTAIENFSWIAPVSANNITDFALSVADVDNSGAVVANDALIAMRRGIGLLDRYPNATPNFRVAGGADYPQAPSTLFDANGAFTDGTPAGGYFYTADVVGQDGVLQFNIYYIATGDVNASYVPQAGAKAQMAMNYQDVLNVSVGEEVRIPVRIDHAAQLGAITLGLHFDNSLIEVTGIEGFDTYRVDNENGAIDLAWMDLNARTYASNETMFIVNARVLAPIDAQTEYFALDGMTEFADAFANPVNASLNTTALNSGLASVNENMQLDAVVYPNPFNYEANFAYTLPESGKVQLVVYNQLGQAVVTLVNEAQIAGQHTVQLDNSMLTGAGTYYYRITLEGGAKSHTLNGTLILVK